ncbi:MAG TPA: hypothetical protein VFR37_19555, partial [Longimicrobium sp.]|nr:hypothetical protein [Longimicrobium sp.]
SDPGLNGLGPKTTAEHGGEDWRSVPADDLRAFLTTETENLGSLRAVRRGTGVSIKALTNFLAGTAATQDRVMRPLALYYLGKGGIPSDPYPKPSGKPLSRRVDVETLRTYFAEECARLGKRRVSRTSGVSGRTLYRFIDEGAVPRRRVRRALTTYYRSKDGQLSERPVAHVKPGCEDPDAPWRRIPVETQRDYFAEESKRVRSAAAVAAAAGVGTTTLKRFLAGKQATQEHILRALGTYYLSREGQLSDPAGSNVRRPPRPRARRVRSPETYPFSFPATEIREYIFARAEESSLRVMYAEIHAEVGLADETVGGFLHETRAPTNASARKLATWYASAVVRSPASKSGEHRCVPLDELHKFYTEAVARAPAEWIAEVAAVSLTALNRFLAKQGRLQLRTQRNLGLYYIARGGIPSDPPPNLRQRGHDDAGSAHAGDGRVESGPAPDELRIQAIRAYARLRAGAKTAAVIAKDADLNFSTFYNFLRGNNPIPRIREKLESWYQRDSATTAGAETLRSQLSGGGNATSAEPVVPDELLRTFFAAAVSRGTAAPASVATNAGVSTTSLERFLAGEGSDKETTDQLRKVYGGHVLGKAAALDAMLEDLDGYVRTRARRRVLSAIGRGYKEAGAPTPGWLEFLVAQPL